MEAGPESVSTSGVRYRGHYVGGPLDGQPATATGRNRWALYRDDSGHTLQAARGDAEFIDRWNRRKLEPRRFYVRQQVVSSATEEAEEVSAVIYAYVHGPRLHSWLEQRGRRTL